jgi:hypothetical protein
MSYPAQKLHTMGMHAAWGGRGSRAVLYDLEQVFNAEPDAILEADDLCRALQQRTLPVLKHHYENFIEDVPAAKTAGAMPSTYVLAAGFAGDRPFIVDIDPHGLIGHYEETGFQAASTRKQSMASASELAMAEARGTRTRWAVRLTRTLHRVWQLLPMLEPRDGDRSSDGELP